MSYFPQFDSRAIARSVAVLGLNLAVACTGLAAMMAAPSAAAEVVVMRKELAVPLLAAQELIKAQKFDEALARIREADAAPGKTPDEQLVIERNRAVAAYGAGDLPAATAAWELVLAGGKLEAADRMSVTQSLYQIYYKAKNYPKAIVWMERYNKEGGVDPAQPLLLAGAYYLSGDYPRATATVEGHLRTEEAAGRTLTEDELKLLVLLAERSPDKAAYGIALERLATVYPRKEFVANLLNRVPAKAGFSDRLVLDVYRLKLAIGTLANATAYTDAAQLATTAGYPAEARAILEAGFKAGVLGSGPDAAKHKKLIDQAAKAASDDIKTMEKGEAEANTGKDGTGLVNLGYAFVTAGQNERGIALMEKGVAKGGLRRADDARLHLGIAYLRAGKTTDALRTFKTVQGNDGTADLARLWIMQAGLPA